MLFLKHHDLDAKTETNYATHTQATVGADHSYTFSPTCFRYRATNTTRMGKDMAGQFNFHAWTLKMPRAASSSSESINT